MISERRGGRRLAFQTLFEVNQTGHDPEEVLRIRSQDLDEADDALAPGATRFALELVEGVARHRDAVDRFIVEAAPQWPIDQIAASDRAALEIGAFEAFVQRDTPVQVAINEAVELAKTFGGPNSGNFVNGVLRTIAERSAAHSQA